MVSVNFFFVFSIGKIEKILDNRCQKRGKVQEEFLMEKGWLEQLKGEFSKPYMVSLQAFLAKEMQLGKVIYPPPNLIFNALCQTPFDKVKVVIMGQDPYHNPKQAEGMCFSVAKEVPPPPSLINIYKEIKDDLGVQIPKTGSLISWARQGVLLLNATLTVEASKPHSHYGNGWEEFTDRVIELLSKKADPIVFMLWGRSAKEKCSKVLDRIKHPHLVLFASHPSPLSAYNGFFGCQHFSKANTFLEKQGKTPINWAIT